MHDKTEMRARSFGRIPSAPHSGYTPDPTVRSKNAFAASITEKEDQPLIYRSGRKIFIAWKDFDLPSSCVLPLFSSFIFDDP